MLSSNLSTLVALLGNMANWWHNDTLEAYKRKIECFKVEYGNFTVAGENVNGQQTLGENIAGEANRNKSDL